ncbi:uncharacterized protein [Epargyreus clarus]|uniref:uncharacterized protein n=1 Tax=Epargyreus clarus TaxID=520877 RepID=UPI003C30E4DE
MSGDFPFPAKTVSPVKCNEKPWDLWISEIGYRSPRRDDEAGKPERARRRRAGLNRLRCDAMSLHGLLPQMDTLDAAVCHMCGVVVKCSAAYRHLLEAHSATEPLLPPPPPAPAVKPKTAPGRSRPKKEPPPPPPPPEAPPPPPPTPPRVPPPDLQYLDDGTAHAELQVSVETGDLPVVSIQDPEDLPLGENLTDDIFAIMNSEGIRSADDITNAADWKNIIRDIDMQEINFPTVADPIQNPDPYAPVDPPMAGYTSIQEADLAGLQFAPDASPASLPAMDGNTLNVQALKPATPSTRTSRKGKPKFNLREYDPNKHCGVTTAENPKPCTRSLTCKAHALSLRRGVEGRAKPFDTLLAEHRAAREAAHQPPPPPLPSLPPVDLGALNGLADDQRVDDIYASLLGDEDPDSVLPDTSGITALLSQPPAEEPEAEPPDGVCWYPACPRPLALCTFNASHAGGAVALGKRYATVRGNIKSSLARPCKAEAGAGGGGAGRAAGRAARPELRRLVVTCRGGVQATLSELFAGEARLNGHAGGKARLKGKRPAAVLDLGFSLDPLLADEKC